MGGSREEPDGLDQDLSGRIVGGSLAARGVDGDGQHEHQHRDHVPFPPPEHGEVFAKFDPGLSPPHAPSLENTHAWTRTGTPHQGREAYTAIGELEIGPSSGMPPNQWPRD